MSFETKIPEHIKTLEAKKRKLSWDRMKLLHDCDCEYCEYNGEFVDEEAEEQAGVIDEQIKEIDIEITRLKDYADRKGVAVEVVA